MKRARMCKSKSAEPKEVPIDDVNADADDEQQNALTNPLHNPLVLIRLFELCSENYLVKFRTVSKHWYNLSLPSWRSSVVITLDQTMFYEDDGTFWTCRKGRRASRHDVTSMHRFLEYVEAPENECRIKPYRRFRLKSWNFERNKVLADRFLDVCGEFIHFLELIDCTLPNVEEFRYVIYERCPNLKRLDLKEYKIVNMEIPIQPSKYEKPKFGENASLKTLLVDMDYRELPVSWLELFNHFPSVSNLTIFNANVPDSVKDMFHAIYLVRKHDSKKLPIKHVDMLSASLYAQETFPADVWAIVKSLQLPLESLTIDFGISTEHSMVKEILASFAPTLQKLDAYRGLLSTPYESFPFGIQLENLQELYMSDRLSHGLEFLKFTPNLKKFHLIYAVSSSDPYISTKIIKNTNKEMMKDVVLDKLTLLNVGYVVNEDDLSHLLTWFPNVERLQMKLSNEQFSMVCEHWQKLVFIEVLGLKLTDRGITGIDPEKKGAARKPNITDLKALRVFVMDGEEITPTKLGDVSAYEGFLKMESLQALKISARMGAAAKEALEKNISNCEINTNFRAPSKDDESDNEWVY